MAEQTDTIVLNCPGCQGRLSARTNQIGQMVQCPLCHRPFEVQAPTAVPSKAPTGRLFHFQCLRCGSILEARSGQGGHSGKCPTCAAVFTVPEMDPQTGLARANADPGDDGENPTPVHAYAAAGTMAPKLIRHGEDDSLSIECPRCQRQSPVTADNCPGCGLPFTMEGVSATAVTSGSSLAQTAWILALVGLVFSFCAGIGGILGLVAIIMGVSALSQRYPRRGQAMAAIVLGAVDCIVSVAILANM
jgi:DNA-directed RNA polymerase subunit M/transcription elongation factor TFIIS